MCDATLEWHTSREFLKVECRCGSTPRSHVHTYWIGEAALVREIAKPAAVANGNVPVHDRYPRGAMLGAGKAGNAAAEASETIAFASFAPLNTDLFRPMLMEATQDLGGAQRRGHVRERLCSQSRKRAPSPQLV